MPVSGPMSERAPDITVEEDGFAVPEEQRAEREKMNKSLCSSRDRLSCVRSRDSRHAITLEGKALVTPFGWNIKAESEDSARGPAAKPRPAGEMLKL
jgi:hypothetical protein